MDTKTKSQSLRRSIGESSPRIGQLICRDRSEWAKFKAFWSNDRLEIGDWQVMQDWERPVMQRMAAIVSGRGKSVLEIGFGLGIAADYIQSAIPARHLIIEAHPAVAERALAWARSQVGKVVVLRGFWEDIVPQLDNVFDGILFDAFPQLSQADVTANRPFYEYSATFFPFAARSLGKTGRFTYWSHERYRLSRHHYELLRGHFRTVKLHRLTGLHSPPDCTYWPFDSIVVPEVSH